MRIVHRVPGPDRRVAFRFCIFHLGFGGACSEEVLVISGNLDTREAKQARGTPCLQGRFPQIGDRGVRRGAQRLGGSVTLRSKTANPQ
jgi:hypothetical protein